MSDPITVTYLQVDGLDIHLPVGVQGALPALVHFHGGGLVTGARNDGSVRQWGGVISIIQSLTSLTHIHPSGDILARGIAFISADHRLLLPYTSHDQITDVRAIFSLLASPTILSSYLPADVTIDSTRIAVAGTSAGGYIAALAALHANPRPKVVLNLFGMGGDFLLDHTVQPHSTGMRGVPPIPRKDEVAPLLEAPIRSASAPMSKTANGFADVSGRIHLVSWFYHTGEFLDYVTGTSGLSERLRELPYDERAAAVPHEARAVLPQLLRDSDHPPTIFLHGAEDSAVPVTESEHAYEQLKSVGVETELIVLPDAEHGLVKIGERVPVDGYANAIARGIEFIAAKLV